MNMYTNRIVHFEIHAEDPERAAKFYKDVFNWKIEKYPGEMEYWSIITGEEKEAGMNGGLLRRPGKNPEKGNQKMRL